jgi:hypothetical protein
MTIKSDEPSRVHTFRGALWTKDHSKQGRLQTDLVVLVVQGVKAVFAVLAKSARPVSTSTKIMRVASMKNIKKVLIYSARIRSAEWRQNLRSSAFAS